LMARALWFTSARTPELVEEEIAPAGPGEVTVRGIASPVSAGTEMLVYRGDLPAEDELGLETCAGSFGFPAQYAYQLLGRVDAVRELSDGRGADVAIEASGAPAALQSAIVATGQEGTIVAISFFGKKTVPLVLSPEFHYRRQRLISSQVSTIGSGLQPRWTLP